MLKKYWNEIRRGLAVALSASLLAGTMTVSASLPSVAASNSRVETDAKGGVTITLDGREVWQAASAAMQKADAVTGDIAERIMAQTGSNGNPVVLEDEIYKMDLPTEALKGLPTGLGMDMYISAGAEDAAEDDAAAEEEEAAAVTAGVSSASDLAHTATGVAERPVRDFFASNMFSLIRENDDSAPAGMAAAAGGEGYELNGSEHIYFVLSNATDQDVNYTIKMGGMELLKTKVLKSHGNTEGVIGATVSSLIGIPASTSNMTRSTGSDMATASGLMGEAELTDDVVAKVVRTTLKNFFVIYRSDETDLGTKVMVVTTADTKFKAEGGGLLSGRTEKPVLHVEDVLKGTKKYEDAEKALQDNDVDHADFAAVDISFRKSAGGTEDYEPYEGQIVNVRIETRAIADFNPDSVSIQHHLEDGTLETVAGTTRKTKKTFIEINDDAADGAISGTTTLTEDNQTEVTLESDNDGNVYTFDEDANRALMQKQLNRAKSKSTFRMSVGSGETRLENDTESETGAPKKTTSAKTAAKTSNNTSTANTVSSNVDANGIKTEVKEEKGKGGLRVEDGKIVADFVVDSFSLYTIVDSGDDARIILKFHNVNGDVHATVRVKKNDEGHLEEIIYDPGIGGDVPAGAHFRGWTTEGDYTPDDTPMTIEQVRSMVLARLAAGITDEITMDLYPMVFNVYQVTFLDEAGVVIKSDNAFGKTEEVEYIINEPYIPMEQDENFEGWKVSQETWQNIKDGQQNAVYANETSVILNGNVILTPYVPAGQWLIFRENGKGATYTKPQFIYTGESTEEPVAPERHGYIFDGWFEAETSSDGVPLTDEDGNIILKSNAFTFGQTLTNRTILYAKWAAVETAGYTVVIWKQRMEDTYAENTGTDAQGNSLRNYDFAEAYSFVGNVGNIINTVAVTGNTVADVEGSYRNVRISGRTGDGTNITNREVSYTGFHYASSDENIKIVPEGTSVVNVYYDRNAVTYTFYYPYGQTEGYHVTQNTNNGYYYIPDESAPDGYRQILLYREGNHWYYYTGETAEEYIENDSRYSGYYYIPDGEGGYKEVYLTRSGNRWSYNTGEYDYQVNNSNQAGYYYIPDDNGGYELVYLYRDRGRWYKNREWEWTSPITGHYYYYNEYSGRKYTRTEHIENYSGPKYTIQTVNVRENYYGDVYLKGGSGWSVYQQSTGLYGETLQWPENDSIWWYPEAYGSSVSGTRMTYKSAYLPDGTDMNVIYYGESHNSQAVVRFYIQTVDGGNNYTLAKTVNSSGGGFTINDKFTGFEAYQYRYYTGNGFTSWRDVGSLMQSGNEWFYDADPDSPGLDSIPGSSVIEIRFKRQMGVVTFMDGKYVNGNNIDQKEETKGTLNQSEPYYYQADISSFNEDSYVPDPVPGYVFAGWYADETCTQQYTFTTMPAGGVTVYAKWVKTQYRVFLHAETPESDSSLDWGDQEMSFRIDSGGQISSVNGIRDDYELIGWYRDIECTEPFNFEAFVLNDDTVTDIYDKTRPTELNKYSLPERDEGGQQILDNKDVNRPWITRSLDLYAKWRAKLEGAKGIRVEYDACEGTNAPLDNIYYEDQGEAIAGAASTPNDSTKQFKHWVIQSWENDAWVDTTKVVIPGENFVINKDDARVEDITDGTQTELIFKKYTVRLRAEYEPIGQPLKTSLIYHANGGTFETLDTAYTVSSNKVTATLNDLQINQAVTILGKTAATRTGYVLRGWSFYDDNDPEKIVDGLTSFGSVVGVDHLNREDPEFAGESITQPNTFNNTLYAVWEKVPVLTVKKVVTGNMGNKAKEFTFSIVLTNSAKDIEDCLADYAGKYVKGSDGQYTVTIGLKDTDSFTVSLPGGTQYSIAENDYSSEGYTTTYTNYTKDSTVELAADTTVTVTNHRDVTVPTGINTDLHFWKWLVGACFLALIGAAMYGRKKRRM